MAFVDRIRGILLEPKNEWPKVAQEAATAQSLYLSWIALLAAIGPVVLFISSGMSQLGLRFALGAYVGALIYAALLAVIADAITTSFGGTRDYVATLKLIGYGFAPLWISEIAFFVPLVNFLILLAGGVYTTYLWFLGAPVLKRCAADRAGAYTFVVVLCAIVLFYLMQRIVYGLGTGAGALVMPAMSAT